MAVICGSNARSLGRKMRVGQLATMAGEMVEVSMSARLWVEKMTLAFCFRRVLRHYLSRWAKAGLYNTSQPSSMRRRVGDPSSIPAGTRGGKEGVSKRRTRWLQ